MRNNIEDLMEKKLNYRSPTITSFIKAFTRALKDVIVAINNDDREEFLSCIGSLMNIVKEAYLYSYSLSQDYEKYGIHGDYIPTLAYLIDKASEEIIKEKRNGK